jgi:hypothetical protein
METRRLTHQKVKQEIPNDDPNLFAKRENQVRIQHKKQIPQFNIKKGGSIYLKILMNYLQIIAIIHSIDLRWPFYTNDFLKANSQAASVTNEVLSFDCIIHDYEIQQEPIHIKAMIGVIMPFVMFFAIFVMFLLNFLKTGKSQKNRIIMSLVVLCIFLQPSVLKQLFDNLNCKRIGDEIFLTKQMNLKCNDDSHQKWVFI